MVYKPWEVQGNLENLENLMFANILFDNILMFENILLSLQPNKYISECIWKNVLRAHEKHAF